MYIYDYSITAASTVFINFFSGSPTNAGFLAFCVFLFRDVLTATAKYSTLTAVSAPIFPCPWAAGKRDPEARR